MIYRKMFYYLHHAVIHSLKVILTKKCRKMNYKILIKHDLCVIVDISK